ncbi:hypothetical protein SARC_05567 [Sphaeroforma arctica JP610]|uniref:Uncharacterized protein n=1 Tax=Sphaeroforma arctica JP610 TaxID=667725 RepID=A0A0L0FZ94_9EUKA|nr:hypothetical protein SARC_05567 [Sphaeroforma arctica JP610]KNC82147.1 hypothetical protein SARC_05567 [Sphaeroforma arctica JP610]|eukprot:XP_014156049.1 hypothetical protein SARC_05567 [Sphaeroforma arctica JP610]
MNPEYIQVSDEHSNEVKTTIERVNNEERTLTYSEAQVKKTKGIPFGAKLGLIDGRVYAIWVYHREEGPNTGAKPAFLTDTVRTAAYRSGLRFGTEVTHVNDLHVIKDFGGDLEACERYMKEETFVKLNTISHMETHRMPRDKTRNLGLSFLGDGTIAKVEPGSLAEDTGLSVRRWIYCVDEKHHTLGRPPQEIHQVLKNVLNVKMNKHTANLMNPATVEKYLSGFSVVCVPKSLGKELERIGNEICERKRSNLVYDINYALDHNMQVYNPDPAAGSRMRKYQPQAKLSKT